MQKPTSMMVTGILNLAFASLGLLMGVWGLIQPFIPMPGAEAFTDLYKDGTFLLTVIGLGLIGMATKGLMWFSGLGLVKGKAFGRSLGNLWAPISMVYGLTSAAVQGAYILPKTFAAQQAWMQAQPNASSQAMQQQIQIMQTMSDIMIWGTVVMGVLTALVYQIIFLILNNRKAVKDYLAAEASGQTWDSAPAGAGSPADDGGDASPWQGGFGGGRPPCYDPGMAWRRVIQILGGVCIGIGVLSLCSNLNEMLVGMMGPDESMKDAQGVPAMMQDSMEAQYRALNKRGYRAYLGVAGALDSLAAVMAIVAGIGLLRVSRWGRRLAIIWGGYALVSSAVGVMMSCRYLFPEIVATSSQSIPDGSVYFFGLLMLLVLWAFPATLLTVLMFAGAKGEFDRPAAALRPVPASADRPMSAPPHATPAPAAPGQTQAHTATTPAPPPPALQTWRDDPWNDPDAT